MNFNNGNKKYSRLFSIVIALLLILAETHCDSSTDRSLRSPEKIPNLVTVTPPPDSATFNEARVYVDTVSLIRYRNNLNILIKGDFPDGCTYIGDITSEIRDNRVDLMLHPWRDPGKICTQALQPFSILYSEFSDSVMASLDRIYLNGKEYSLNRN